MILRRNVSEGLIALALALALPAQTWGVAQKKSEAYLEKIPVTVMEALKSKFPKAEIHAWTREKEGDTVVFDFEFSQEGRKYEADILENGAIHNWEREVSVRDLPAAVMKAVEAKYPSATIKEIMEITAVQAGKEALEGYEVVLETVAKKEVEITVAPDGKTLEDSSDGK